MQERTIRADIILPCCKVAATPQATVLRAVVDIWFDGNDRLAAEHFATSRSNLWRMISGFISVSPAVVRTMLAMAPQITPSLIAQSLAREAEYRAKLRLLEAATKSLPDPDLRPYERTPGKLGGARTRSDRQDRKLRLERDRERARLAALPPGADPTPRKPLDLARMLLGDAIVDDSPPEAPDAPETRKRGERSEPAPVDLDSVLPAPDAPERSDAKR